MRSQLRLGSSAKSTGLSSFCRSACARISRGHADTTNPASPSPARGGEGLGGGIGEHSNRDSRLLRRQGMRCQDDRHRNRRCVCALRASETRLEFPATRPRHLPHLLRQRASAGSENVSGCGALRHAPASSALTVPPVSQACTVGPDGFGCTAGDSDRRAATSR